MSACSTVTISRADAIAHIMAGLMKADNETIAHGWSRSSYSTTSSSSIGIRTTTSSPTATRQSERPKGDSG
jgi:hypothetical protein